MRPIGVLFLILAAGMFAVASMNARQSPNISHLVGTFLPAVAFLIIGLKLGQPKK